MVTDAEKKAKVEKARKEAEEKNKELGIKMRLPWQKRGGCTKKHFEFCPYCGKKL